MYKMGLNFLFFDNHENLVDTLPCKGLLDSKHYHVIAPFLKHELHSSDMAECALHVMEYLENNFPWVLKYSDIEDWTYEPNYQLFHKLMHRQDYDSLQKYYRMEEDKVAMFADKTKLYDLWKLKNIYEIMQKYSIKTNYYAVFSS